MHHFGEYVRARRESHLESDPRFSKRQIALRIGLDPELLDKVERGAAPPLSEDTIKLLADELGEDHDLLLALAGLTSADLRDAIFRRPKLFALLIRELRSAPEHSIYKVERVSGVSRLVELG